jgi:predicted transcriptional regulator
MNTDGNDPHLTAKIVSQYVAHHKLTAGEIPNLIATVHQAIGHLGQPAEQEDIRTPAVSVRRSVHQDYVVCLDCDFRALILRRHIRVQHGLSPEEYQQRWGLKNTHPLTAPAYSERRSKTAKTLGFGRKPSMETTPAQVVAESPMPIAAESETEPTPKRRARTRSTKAADGDTKAATTGTPTKKARSRSRAGVASKPDQAA